MRTTAYYNLALYVMIISNTVKLCTYLCSRIPTKKCIGATLLGRADRLRDKFDT